MGNTLTGTDRARTTPTLEELAEPVSAIETLESYADLVEEQLRQHQTALLDKAGDDAASAAVQYWTRVSRCRAKCLEAMRALVVLLLEAIEDDLDGLYDNCPDTQQRILQQHASLCTDTAAALAEDSRGYAARRFYAGSSEGRHASDHRVDCLLRQAYPAYRHACFWGSAAAIERAAMGVRHLLAQHHACVRFAERNLRLSEVEDPGCPCSLCDGDDQSACLAEHSTSDSPCEGIGGASVVRPDQEVCDRAAAGDGPGAHASSNADSSASGSSSGSFGSGAGGLAPPAAPRAPPDAGRLPLHQRRGFSQSVT